MNHGIADVACGAGMNNVDSVPPLMVMQVKCDSPRRNRLSASSLLAVWLYIVSIAGCQSQAPLRFAVIPRTTGTLTWEPLHHGVEVAAYSVGATIYWNAPTREDDIDGQIALIERLVAKGHYQGIVIAPDQSLALVTPVRRSLAKGIPIVILGSPLLVPPQGKLFYVLNDEQKGGHIAAQRVAALLKGRGTVAILGINPDIAGTLLRARSFEQFLSKQYPGIRIVDKRMGSFNVPHEQQAAEETLKANPHLDAIVALSPSTTQGALSMIDSHPEYSSVKLIGFDPDSLDFSSKNLDSVILQNMPEMGERAIHLLYAVQEGKPVPSQIEVEPMLVTRETVGSVQVRRWTSVDFRPGSRQPDWGSK